MVTQDTILARPFVGALGVGSGGGKVNACRERICRALPAIDDGTVNLQASEPTRLTPAAVLVPLLPRPQGWQLLLTRRPAHLRHHPGQIAFPGGRREVQDRSLVDTALRETHEEIGVSAQYIHLVGRLAEHATVTGFRVTPVVGIVDPLVSWQADVAEVAEIFEVPLDFILDPNNHQRCSGLWQGQRRHYYVIHYRCYEIWGATAAMLVDFSRRYHGDALV